MVGMGQPDRVHPQETFKKTTTEGSRSVNGLGKKKKRTREKILVTPGEHKKKGGVGPGPKEVDTNPYLCQKKNWERKKQLNGGGAQGQNFESFSSSEQEYLIETN